MCLASVKYALFLAPVLPAMLFDACSNKLPGPPVKLSVCVVQLPALLAHGQANEVMLVCHEGPDAACTAQLQELVDSSHASIIVLVIPVELTIHTDRQSAVGVALQDLPTPCAVLVMHAPEPAGKAPHVSNDVPELSAHSVLDSAHSSGGMGLAEVTVKVRTAATAAMGDGNSDEAGLEDGEPLLAAGLTSAGAVEIVRLLEKEFDITLADTLVSPAHLHIWLHTFAPPCMLQACLAKT